MNLHLTMILLCLGVWNLDWSMFQGAGGVQEFCINGYGDWSPPSVGAHPGLDFEDPSTEPHTTILYSPSNETTYYRFDGMAGGDTGFSIFLTETPDAMSGWQFSHLDLIIQSPLIPYYNWGDPVPPMLH